MWAPAAHGQRYTQSSAQTAQSPSECSVERPVKHRSLSPARWRCSGRKALRADAQASKRARSQPARLSRAAVREGSMETRNRRVLRTLDSGGAPEGRASLSDAARLAREDVQFEHSGRATYGDAARGKRGRCPSGSPATSAARAWRDRLQARAARDFAPSKRDKAKTQLHRYMPAARLPPRRSSSVGETATPVTERSWECLRLTPGRSLLLRLFVSSILRLSEDVWFLHLCKIGRLLPQSL